MPMATTISGGGGGGLAGAKPRNYNPASGGIPGVTSPIDAITGNLGGLGGIIGSITGSQSTALRNQYPDEYFSTLGTLLGNTGRRAKGDISDLLPELQQSSAENAVYGGMSGSQAENTKLLRDLGLTRYGVQNEAINSLGKIQGEIPTVKPFDPSAIINDQLNAQERADLYASAPVPESAYQRANQAAGNPIVGTGGLRYDLGGGGGAARPTDAIMRGYGAPTIGYGTNQNLSQGGGSAPWGSFPNAISAGGEDQDPFAWLFEGDTPTGNVGNFGGSLGYGGGAAYDPWTSPQNQQTSQNYSDLDPWLASILDIGGGVDMSSGGGFYGGGEDFGLNDGSYYDEGY